MPSTDRALERTLQVDVLANLQDDNAVRAGFNGSGVSRNNRLIERHDAAHGAYWRATISATIRVGKISSSIRSGRRPARVSFVHAGGEIIFHLPNGLQAYLLVDGAGRRIDKAPGDIVSDPKRPDRLVETGLSCISCHVSGILPKDDQVRAHVLKNAQAFAKGDRETVQALYAPRRGCSTLMEEDNERFRRALKQAGVAAGEPEPIMAAALRYEATVDLPNAAAEAGLSRKSSPRACGGRRTLSRSLVRLLAKGGTIQRQVFQDTFADMARSFHLGEDTEATTVSDAPDAVRRAAWFRARPGVFCRRLDHRIRWGRQDDSPVGRRHRQRKNARRRAHRRGAVRRVVERRPLCPVRRA